MLMISAMFMFASCGSKSEVAKVEFTDPAISYNGGIDLSSYFSAESITPPGLYDNGRFHKIASTLKLKLIKKLDIEYGDYGYIDFVVNFCDNNGSKIVSSYNTYSRSGIDFNEMSVGTVFSLDLISNEREVIEQDMQKKLDKIKKIEVKISTKNITFKGAEASEGID